jgi:GT2 family glycosyltransferase
MFARVPALDDRLPSGDALLDSDGRVESAVHDIAVIIVSTNQGHWLRRCLTSVFERSGHVSLDLVVVDNGGEDGAAELVERDVPAARVIRCPNHGFAHANNRALRTCHARYVLFLNPDTELLEGTLAELVDELDHRADVGAAGVRQLSADGTLYPSMRNFPSISRALGDAVGLERLRNRPSWLGEREVDPSRYEAEFESDWTIGSFLLVRREALEGAGSFDERFFIYSEEVDLCLRLRRAGWKLLYLPSVTILHHIQTGRLARGSDPRFARQNAFSQLQYGRKNFPPTYRATFRSALLLRYGLRSLAGGDARQRAAARAAAGVVLGRGGPPFEAPPGQAVERRGAERE